MKINEILEATKKHKYVGLRTYRGRMYGVTNYGVRIASKKMGGKNPETQFFSYNPLNINEYISCKIPYL